MKSKLLLLLLTAITVGAQQTTVVNPFGSKLNVFSNGAISATPTSNTPTNFVLRRANGTPYVTGNGVDGTLNGATPTEMSYLQGLLGNVQDQINAAGGAGALSTNTVEGTQFSVTPIKFAIKNGTKTTNQVLTTPSFVGTIGQFTSSGSSEFLSILTIDGILKNNSSWGFDIGASSGRWRIDHAGTAPYEYRVLGSDDAAHGMLASDIQLTDSVKYARDANLLFVFDGDSLSSDASTRWSRQFLTRYPRFARFTTYFKNVAGSTSSDAVSRYAANVTPLVSASQVWRIYSLRTGVNDLDAGASANTVYANLKTLADNARADGFNEVWVWDVMPSTALTGAKETARVALNAFLASDKTHWDKLIRISQVMTQPTNTTYFADGTHPTAVGAAIEADTAFNSAVYQPWDSMPNTASSWNTNRTNIILRLNPRGGAVQIGEEFSLGRTFGRLRLDAAGSGSQPFQFIDATDVVTGVRMGALSAGVGAGDAPANGIATSGIIRQTQVGGFSLGSDSGHYRIDANGADPYPFRFLTDANGAAGALVGALQVNGLTASSPVFTDGSKGLTSSGTVPVANGGTGAGAFTQGSVVFAGASGVYSQNNSLFYWDDLNGRLGIGTNAPGAALGVIGFFKQFNATDTAKTSTMSVNSSGVVSITSSASEVEISGVLSVTGVGPTIGAKNGVNRIDNGGAGGAFRFLNSGNGAATVNMGQLDTTGNVNGATPTEMGYLSGVTSALQTQINAKAPSTAPTFATSATFSYATASTVPYLNGSKQLVSSAVTPTELGYVSGVTSGLQTQLNAKVSTPSGTGLYGGAGGVPGESALVMYGDATGVVDSGTYQITIANNAVTLAKMADIATASVIGRNTSGTGDPEVLTTLPNGVQDNITRLGTVTSGSLDAARITSGTMATARLGSGTANSSTYLRGDNTWQLRPAEIGIACSDETTALTAGTAKVTFRMPFAMTLTAVRASVNTASTSGLPTINLKEGGTTVFSTKVTIDANELTSTTAATPAVISDSSLADDAEMTVDIDVAGTGAKGLKIWLIGTR